MQERDGRAGSVDKVQIAWIPAEFQIWIQGLQCMEACLTQAFIAVKLSKAADLPFSKTNCRQKSYLIFNAGAVSLYQPKETELTTALAKWDINC